MGSSILVFLVAPKESVESSHPFSIGLRIPMFLFLIFPVNSIKEFEMRTQTSECSEWLLSNLMSVQNFCTPWREVALTKEYSVIGCASLRPFVYLIYSAKTYWVPSLYKEPCQFTADIMGCEIDLYWCLHS